MWPGNFAWIPSLWWKKRFFKLLMNKLETTFDMPNTCDNAPINVKPEGGGPRAYVGHLTFQKIFWSKSPPWGPKTGSNKIKYPHLREVISLKFIVVVVYILQIIDINCQAFFLYFKLL